MRPVLLLVAVLLAVGCGEAETEPGGGGAIQNLHDVRGRSASGDTSGVLGLVVDAAAPLEMRPAGPPGACEAR